MTKLLRTKNFVFSWEAINHGNGCQICASVYIYGVRNRFVVGSLPVIGNADKRSLISDSGEIIINFISELLSKAMPLPAADYQAIMEKVNYKPWDVVVNARRIGKPKVTRLATGVLVEETVTMRVVGRDNSRYRPYYSHLTEGIDELQAYYFQYSGKS